MQASPSLSVNTIDIVKSTAPILSKKGQELTQHFYSRMFKENPEVKSFFNTSNQNGTQQRALAAAITAYAANIDNLELLNGAVELIAQKHASLQVKPDHYPIVGSHLLASISHILQLEKDSPVLQAWAEAYNLLANILISRESDIYFDNANKPGGWEGFKTFRILKKRPETRLISSFYLIPEHDSPLPYFFPGQYITVRCATPDGSTTMRNYSLSHEANGKWLRISVKKEVAPNNRTAAGYMSSVLHDQLKEGDILEIAPPCGEFIFDAHRKHTKPIVFIAAGVGITPLICMLQNALRNLPNHDITLIYAATDVQSMAFYSEIESLRLKYHNLNVHYRFSKNTHETSIPQADHSYGYVDEAMLNHCTSGFNAEFYFCGPTTFMTTVYSTLIKNGVPKHFRHFEFFGPQEALENPPLTQKLNR